MNSFGVRKEKIRKSDFQPIISMPSSVMISVLPIISLDKLSRKCNEIVFNLENSSGCTLNTAIPGSFEGENKEMFKKSLSKVSKNLFLLQANSNNLEFLIPLGAYSISTFLDEKKLTNLASTSSSARNLGRFEFNKSLTGQSFSSIMQCSLNMFLSQRRICLKNFFYTCSSFKHLKNLPDHDPTPVESRLSMADFAVCNNEFTNFNPHNLKEKNELFKDCDGEFIDIILDNAGRSG